MKWALLLLIGFLSTSIAVSSGGNKLLVLIDEPAEGSEYSKYIEDLKDRGYHVVTQSPKDEKLSLYELDERVYDHLLILPCKTKGLGPNLTPQLLLDFINKGGNIQLVLSSSKPTPTTLISLLLELDIHLPADRNASIIDHFNYDRISASEKHDVVLVPRPDAIRPDVKNFFRGNGKGGDIIAFPRGIGQTLGNNSPLLTTILRAPRTAYSLNSKYDFESVDDLFAAGSQLSLITAMQARNSARLTVIGSAEMLQNEWFDRRVQRSIGLGGVGSNAKEVKTVNRKFAEEVTGWTFKEIGVLKVGKVEHYLQEQSDTHRGNVTNPKKYRVKNDVTYNIEMSEYSWDKWIPFSSPPGDAIQLEFSMLSPFYRLPLKAVSTDQNSTTFTTSFRLPDQHGIFNFKVNYKRPFLTNVEEKLTVSVRHFAHNEWLRSWEISGAWPWVAGIGATVTGWIIFVALWLWSKPVALNKIAKEKKVQ